MWLARVRLAGVDGDALSRSEDSVISRNVAIDCTWHRRHRFAGVTSLAFPAPGISSEPRFMPDCTQDIQFKLNMKISFFRFAAARA